MMTRNHRQEAFSRAYVRAVAALAGVGVSEPESDYGIDMTLRKISLRESRHRDLGRSVDLQLKSTTRALLGATHLVYDLDVVNYDDLREASDRWPRLLVLVVLPENEVDWLTQTPDELILRQCAYWLSLKGHAPTAATSTFRVAVPLANIFSVDAVEAFFCRVEEGKDL